MGLPDIDIIFRQKAVTAIKRSQRGIACVIVQDDTPGEAGYETYKYEKDIPTERYGAEILKALKKCFYVAVNKIIVLHIPEEAEFSDALDILDTIKYNYVCTTIAGAQQELVNYLVSKNRNTKGRKFIGIVFNATTADSKYIINVKNSWVHDVDADEQVDMENYLPRLTSILANLPMNRSCTYYELEDIDEVDMGFITTEKDIDSWIDDGYLCLIKDDDKIKIGRGVNSLTTFTSTDSEDMKKIIIVESMNLIEEDIFTTYKNYYVGKYKNHYDNQCLFMSAVNTYFRELQREEILDPEFDNRSFVDVELQRDAWLAIGKIEAQDWTAEKVKRMTFKSNLFLAGDIKILDAMEDLRFTINME